MPTNIIPHSDLSDLLLLIGQPVRLQILAALDGHEACVCHLEAALGLRQAALSQHLMILRKAHLVHHRREGRNIYYRLANPQLLPALRRFAAAAGVDLPVCVHPVPGCWCPLCNSVGEG